MVSFIMQKGKHMKFTKGVYQTNKVLVLRSYFGLHPVQAMAREFIHIENSIRGGYIVSKDYTSTTDCTA